MLTTANGKIRLQTLMDEQDHVKKFSWKIGGEAGFGIKSAGMSFAKCCYRSGYHVFDNTEYPSLIRGGHNTYQVTVSSHPVHSVDEHIDILVALNKETVDKHQHEMTEGSAIIYDGDEFQPDVVFFRDKKITLLHVPFKKLSLEACGTEIMRNTVAMGATMALIKLPSSFMEDIMKEVFSHKPAVIESNIKAVRLGYSFIEEHYRDADTDFKVSLSVREKGHRMYVGGNEAQAIGAIAAGCNFYSGYPMTPSSSILHYMASKAVSEGIIFKHAEDEIAVLNMALGASLVGARAMVGTSGGGFSLMVETLGLAGITETPVVIVNCQRPGPATGMPTWTDQGDLRFILHAAQGEFPRIVMAPGDIEECFYLTVEAFNLADRYQMPVILLSDKTLGEGVGTVPIFDEKKVVIDRGAFIEDGKVPKDYKRYQVTENGVSPRTFPGMEGGIFCGNSDEHDEYGYSNEESLNRIDQVNKRARKLEYAAKFLESASVNLIGPEDADITLVCWGSPKGVIVDALDELPLRVRKRFRVLQIVVLWPFPSERVKSILEASKRVILIENNSEAQLAGLIRQMTGFDIREKILKYDGRSFFADEVAQKLIRLKCL
ncbi:2-oxoacid:acceptor oxidoreductase subunit alpha [Candidatus Peregrinibacteria bacterium]|nr:2-oxoacid:acceptor oxidoreductase subunit alpha [Candidatus Peregrinibacteria bacterium]